MNIETYNSLTPAKKLCLLVILSLVFVALFVWAMTAGEYELHPRHIWQTVLARINGLTGPALKEVGISRMDEVIFWNIRLPRLLLATLAGMALSMAGVAYQGCFRNPLVEPYLLGVSAGAAFGTAMAIVFPAFFPQGQASAFGFALLAVFISYSMARSRGQTPTVALVLSGIIVGAFFPLW